MRLCSALAVILTTAACGSDGGLPPAAPVALTVITQPAPSAQSGVAVTPAPSVGLVDRAGNRVATRGVAVSVSLASGIGTVSGTAEVRTDVAGEARFADLRISGPVGAKTLRFTAPGLTGTGSNAIDLVAGPSASIVAEAGNNQTAAAGTPIGVAPAVRISDEAGNPVANVAVSFAVTAGGGAIEGATATTAPDGIARATKWTLGPAAGPNGLVASAGSLSVAFVATATVGPPAKIVAIDGDGQTAVIGNSVTVAPSVKVTDAFGNPVAGVAVTFTASNGGTTTGGPPLTDASGVAKVGGWTLGLAPGTQTLVARASAATATFGATATHFPATALASGSLSTCAVATTGALFCWGDNSAGQLGDGTVANKNIPTLVSAPAQTYTAVVVGGGHACALAAGGGAICWGNNAVGQLGDSTGTNRLTPVAVAGGHLFQSLVAGDLHTCGLQSDGTAWCWGSNGNGRLGDSTLASRAAPVTVKGGLKFTALAAGASHTCGLTASGLFCWGANGSGRLGDGTTTDRRTPTAVVAGAATLVAVAAGGIHTCAIETGGAVWCWGAGTSGVLGTGTTVAQLTPALVAGTAKYSRIATGLGHTCAIATTGTVYCWGANGSGRLGDGTGTLRLVPTPVLGTFSATALDLGDEHSCALGQAGSAICWGRNLEGQLGDGGTVSVPRPLGVKAP